MEEKKVIIDEELLGDDVVTSNTDNKENSSVDDKPNDSEETKESDSDKQEGNDGVDENTVDEDIIVNFLEDIVASDNEEYAKVKSKIDEIVNRKLEEINRKFEELGYADLVSAVSSGMPKEEYGKFASIISISEEDLSDTEKAADFVKKYYKEFEGLSDDDAVDAIVEKLKADGRLSDKALELRDRAVKKYEEEKERIKEEEEKRQQEIQKQIDAYFDNVKKQYEEFATKGFVDKNVAQVAYAKLRSGEFINELNQKFDDIMPRIALLYYSGALDRLFGVEKKVDPAIVGKAIKSIMKSNEKKQTSDNDQKSDDNRNDNLGSGRIIIPDYL